jgi:hypothetical protein
MASRIATRKMQPTIPLLWRLFCLLWELSEVSYYSRTCTKLSSCDSILTFLTMDLGTKVAVQNSVPSTMQTHLMASCSSPLLFTTHLTSLRRSPTFRKSPQQLWTEQVRPLLLACMPTISRWHCSSKRRGSSSSMVVVRFVDCVVHEKNDYKTGLHAGVNSPITVTVKNTRGGGGGGGGGVPLGTVLQYGTLTMI